MSPTNLVSCPDCDHKVSRRAEACPNCGCPIVGRPRSKRTDFVTVHDVNNDGVPDLMVHHDATDVARLIGGVRDAFGIPDDETQWLMMRHFFQRWGWPLCIVCFFAGFGGLYFALGTDIFLGFRYGICGGIAAAAVPFFATAFAKYG